MLLGLRSRPHSTLFCTRRGATATCLPGSGIEDLTRQAMGRICLRTRAWHGDEEIQLPVPDSWTVDVLPPVDGPELNDSELTAALERPLGCDSLEVMARTASSALILIDDLGRPTPTHTIAPQVVKTLIDAGMPAASISFLVATGSHRQLTTDEIERKLGRDLAARFPVHCHDACNGELVDLGPLPSGMPVVVNRRIVEGIEQLGGSARGMSAKDAEIMRVTQHFAEMEEDGETKQVDIGFVGDVESIDPEPIRRACEGETIPVITPIGLGKDGSSYNVNADTAAGEIARALQAEKLVFLTDVNGICRDTSDPSSRISTLHVNDIESLLDDETIKGGMIPKVRAGERSVKGGVTKTHIIDGRIPHSQLLEMFTREGIGTEIVQ